ncbi:hypothetical protein C0J52_20787 [Blattella germanica]|nr:hypothetical protein C0J52_20787 [Blattella germanica]
MQKNLEYLFLEALSVRPLTIEGGRKKIKRRIQPSRTPTLIKQVKSKVMRKNPPTQNSIARRKGISPQTVGLIIHENLHLQKRHIARGHHLKENHIEERFTNARKLYERHISEYKEKFSKGFMVVADYCSRGQLQSKTVAAKAQFHAVYFQEEVMRSIYLQDIPRLYDRDASKLQIHMDKTSSHTAKSSHEDDSETPRDTVTALADATHTAYIRGRWVLTDSSGQLQHSIVSPSLPDSGDYSAYNNWGKK